MSATCEKIITRIRPGTTSDVADYLEKLAAMLNDASSRIRLAEGDMEGHVVIQMSSELAYEVGEVLVHSVKILRELEPGATEKSK